MVRTFRDEDFTALHKAFVLAFSDYAVRLKPTEEQFAIRLYDKTKMDPDLTGLIGEKELSAFVLHSLNTYQGTKTAYNGGTGVIPGERRKGHIKRIHEYLLPKVKATEASRIVLEVIDSNQAAHILYRSLGFSETNVFRCFRGSLDIIHAESEFREVSQWNPARYAPLKDFEPSFLDSDHQIPFNFKNEILLEIFRDDQLAGYILFQKSIGRISQMAVNPIFRGMGLGRALLSQCHQICNQPISFLNIPESQSGMIRFLEKCGMKNEINQYEMELVI